MRLVVCLLSLASLSVSLVALAAEAPAPIEQQVPSVERRVTKMSWKGRTYRIFISAPQGEPPPKGYPIFYTTDGNGLFDTVAQTSYVQSVYREYTSVSPAVVVAIGYESAHPFDPMRAYDLSPRDPAPPANVEVMRNEAVAGVGGADDFLDFIAQSLKPAIEKDYKIDRSRQALFGHSRGGLFVLHTLFTRPAEFQNYIAASPAIWWHDRFVAKERQQFLAALERQPVAARLLILVGALEQGSSMVANAVEMSQALSGLENKGLHVAYHEFDGEDHLSVIPAAISRAVRFALVDPVGAMAKKKEP